MSFECKYTIFPKNIQFFGAKRIVGQKNSQNLLSSGYCRSVLGFIARRDVSLSLRSNGCRWNCRFLYNAVGWLPKGLP